VGERERERERNLVHNEDILAFERAFFSVRTVEIADGVVLSDLRDAFFEGGFVTGVTGIEADGSEIE
jgi:hypothetical protein